jgi:dUTP pyrophosphatase
VNLGTEEFKIRHGDRIAQLVFCPVVRVRFEARHDIGESRRGSGGFGSTGT